MQRLKSIPVDFTEILFPEIMLHILQFLDYKDLLSASLICKQLHMLTNDYSLWQPVGITKDEFNNRQFSLPKVIRFFSLFNTGNIDSRLIAKKTNYRQLNDQLHAHPLKGNSFNVTVLVGPKLEKASHKLLDKHELHDFIQPFEPADAPHIQFKRLYDECFVPTEKNLKILEENLKCTNGLVIFSNSETEVDEYFQLLKAMCINVQRSTPPVFIGTFTPEVIKKKETIDTNIAGCILLDEHNLPSFKKNLHTQLMRLHKPNAKTMAVKEPEADRAEIMTPRIG